MLTGHHARDVRRQKTSYGLGCWEVFEMVFQHSFDKRRQKCDNVITFWRTAVNRLYGVAKSSKDMNVSKDSVDPMKFFGKLSGLHSDKIV